MTVVQPQNPWGVAQLGDDGRVDGLPGEAAARLLGERRLLRDGAARARLRSARTTCSSASRSSRWPRRASCTPTGTTGFWDCMDTYKDTLLLNELWERGEAPWRPLVET